jgi:hypothetical protein
MPSTYTQSRTLIDTASDLVIASNNGVIDDHSGDVEGDYRDRCRRRARVIARWNSL